MMNQVNDFEALDALIADYQTLSFIARTKTAVTALFEEMDALDTDIISGLTYYEAYELEVYAQARLEAALPNYDGDAADTLSGLMDEMDSPEWLGIEITSEEDLELHYALLDAERDAMAKLCSDYHA